MLSPNSIRIQNYPIEYSENSILRKAATHACQEEARRYLGPGPTAVALGGPVLTAIAMDVPLVATTPPSTAAALPVGAV
jgi:hypothetical protein